MSLLGGVDNQFAFKMLVFSMAILFLLPTALTVMGVGDTSVDEAAADLTEDYREFTGGSATKTAVWALGGVYTPYTGTSEYGWTKDGWLYSERIDAYVPSQYQGTIYGTGAVRDDEGIYRYTADSADGHEAGEIYSAITMDAAQKSDIFFTPAGKTEQDGYFYYEFTGYRYSFSPIADYTGRDADGNPVDVIATTTTLNLIWYEYYNNSGISGQLVLSGADDGRIAYITSQEIVSAFDDVTSTAKFDLIFNSVEMTVSIRLNPYYISQGYSVEDCYNSGYWELMVSSLSVDTDAYTGTDFAFNVAGIFDTMIKIFTFNSADLGLTGWTGTICTLIISVPLYAALLSIGMSWYPALILSGILAAIQSLGGWLF